jgi:hypothetical protein
LLDPIEKPFDPVTDAVEIRAEADRIVAIVFEGMLAQTPFLIASSVIQSAS